MNLPDVLLKLSFFVFTLLITALLSRILSLLIGDLFREWTPSLRTSLQRLASVAVWTVGLIFAIGLLGLKTDLLLLLVGLMGVAVILALREVLENVGAKYFSDLYVPFKVGDIIRVGGQSGKVIEINPVTTVLLTKEEHLISIPNSVFMREKVINLTPHVWKEILIPVTISSSLSLPEFESEVLKACGRFRRYLDERFPPLLTVKGREEKYVNLILTLMVRDPSKKEEIVRELNRKISEIEKNLKRKK